jgi:hypothetical protein
MTGVKPAQKLLPLIVRQPEERETAPFASPRRQ